jgi:hypothetical protein
MIGFDDHIQRVLRGLKLSHLRLMAELRSTGNLTAAAERLGMTQPAASRMLSRIEIDLDAFRTEVGDLPPNFSIGDDQ